MKLNKSICIRFEVLIFLLIVIGCKAENASGIKSNVSFNNINAQTEIFSSKDSVLVKIEFDKNAVVPKFFSLLYLEDLIHTDSIFSNKRVVAKIIEDNKRTPFEVAYTLEDVQRNREGLYENRIYRNLVHYILYESDNQLLSLFDGMLASCDAIDSKSLVKLLRPFAYEVCLNDDGKFIECLIGVYSQIQYYRNIKDPTEGLITKSQFKELEEMVVKLFDIGGFHITHNLKNKSIKKVRHSYACMGMKVDDKRY